MRSDCGPGWQARRNALSVVVAWLLDVGNPDVTSIDCTLCLLHFVLTGVSASACPSSGESIPSQPYPRLLQNRCLAVSHHENVYGGS